MNAVIKIIAAAAILLSLIGCASNAAAAHKTFLGSRVVSDRAEYDVIRIGADEGPFRAVQLQARGAPVEFKRVVVNYANGSEQRFERNVLLRAGSYSPWIDLKGGDRLITKVVFYYETRSPGRHQGQVRLYGIR